MSPPCARRVRKDFATARVRASRISLDDLDDLVQLHLDEAVSRYLGGIRTPDETKRYVETQLQHWRDHGFGLWTLRSPTGQFLGRAGLRWLELAGRRELEIAYTLAQPWWGLGLATEVARAIVALWRSEMASPGLIGVVEWGNAPSERVLLKCGFVRDAETTLYGASVGIFRLVRESSAV
jgi:RimJ/RimL family protein N-acetyltransferase